MTISSYLTSKLTWFIKTTTTTTTQSTGMTQVTHGGPFDKLVQSPWCCPASDSTSPPSESCFQEPVHKSCSIISYCFVVTHQTETPINSVSRSLPAIVGDPKHGFEFCFAMYYHHTGQATQLPWICFLTCKMAIVPFHLVVGRGHTKARTTPCL